MAEKNISAGKSEAVPAKTAEVARIKVLVADEDPRVLHFLDFFFSARNYQPILAPSGAEALEQIKIQRPDIVIIGDFKSKESNLNLLRELRASSDLPVIILSVDDDRHKIESIKSGADDYLSKPFTPDELLARISAVLRRTGSSESREEAIMSMTGKNMNAGKSEAVPVKTAEVAKAKVLVVDEEARILNFLRTFLYARGYQPIFAPSGAEASLMMSIVPIPSIAEMLKQIKIQRPDIAVIGDFKSKEPSNLNLLRGLRARSNLPVIILSRDGEDSQRIAGIASGADDYMSKPFNPEELLVRIKAVLRRTGSSGSREASVKEKLDSLMLIDADTAEKWASDFIRKKERDKKVPDVIMGGTRDEGIAFRLSQQAKRLEPLITENMKKRDSE